MQPKWLQPRWYVLVWFHHRAETFQSRTHERLQDIQPLDMSNGLHVALVEMHGMEPR